MLLCVLVLQKSLVHLIQRILNMRYVLITGEKTRVYHLKICAEMYQNIYGGNLVEVYVGEME